MNFGEALQALKDGKKITRSIWKGHWYLAKGAKVEHNRINAEDGNELEFIDGCNMGQLIIAVLKDDQGCAPAHPYQSDILAEDWQIVD